MMANSLNTLNTSQREAVLFLDGPCLVLAGAGSGKTRVITQKIAYLINDCGYSAQNIVALTFTNKAAQEMMERVRKQLDSKQAKRLTISTFHALGVRFLRQEAKHLNLKQQFSILDATDAASIIQDLLSTTDKAHIRAVQHRISLWKNGLVDPIQALSQARTQDETQAAQVFAQYNATLRSWQAVDFDDLIVLPVKLMQENEEVRTRWQEKVRYLLVDEYQDTNVCQYEWVKLLTGLRHMFTAVGDDDQAIYAWRGATLENLFKLTQDYRDLKIIKLEQNYRSVEKILTAANRVIEHNPKIFGKKLWSELGRGEEIDLLPMEDDEAEARQIALRINRLRLDRHLKWSDFAVLYRGNYQARIFEQVFRQMNIPYSISGGQSFFDKTEVRDIVAWLRLIANEHDDPAFIRAVTSPRRGVGQSTLMHLGEYATRIQKPLLLAAQDEALLEQLGIRQQESLREFCGLIEQMRNQANQPEQSGEVAAHLLGKLVQDIQYEAWLYDTQDDRLAQSRWQSVLDLVQWLSKKAKQENLTLGQLVQYVALITMLERQEGETEADQVKLSTIHASKGLEYPYVFLVGCEEGYLPHMGRDEDDDLESDEESRINAATSRIQEERRLMYVAITRARYYLAVSFCKRRKRAREVVLREPSRFIGEMGLQAYEIHAPDPDSDLSPVERLAKLRAILAAKNQSR